MINKTLLQKRFNVATVSYDQYANVQKKDGAFITFYIESAI